MRSKEDCIAKFSHLHQTLIDIEEARPKACAEIDVTPPLPLTRLQPQDGDVVYGMNDQGVMTRTAWTFIAWIEYDPLDLYDSDKAIWQMMAHILTDPGEYKIVTERVGAGSDLRVSSFYEKLELEIDPVLPEPYAGPVLEGDLPPHHPQATPQDQAES